MANETIKAGDIVRLKSGGFKMTVSNAEGGNAHCYWADTEAKGAIRYQQLPVAILEKVSENEDAGSYDFLNNL